MLAAVSMDLSKKSKPRSRMKQRELFVFLCAIPLHHTPTFLRSLVRTLIHHPYCRLTAALFLALFLTLLLVERPVKMERRIAEREQTLGKSPPTHWLVPVWLWRGLAINTGLAAVLVALSPLATRQLTPRPAPTPAPPRLKRHEILLLAGASTLLLTHALPRLDHSLWGDEEYAMRTYIAPKASQLDDGHWSLTPQSWSTTFWDYTRPTNHIGYTVVARLFHDTLFQPSTAPDAPWFSERAIRLPVLLAGVGALFSLFWCCRVWGLGAAAAWIALAYAGHSWLVRFSSDARGYGFVLLLAPLLLGTLGRALQTGHWRWWLTFGFVQFYLAWTHLGSAHLLIALQLTALWLLWRQPIGQRLIQTTRWLVACIASVMLGIAAMAPVIAPFLGFMKKSVLPGSLDLTWLTDMAAYLACGTPWLAWDSTNPLCISLASSSSLPPWLAATGLGLIGLLLVIGSWQLWQNPDRRPLLLFLLGAPALMLLQLVASHTRPYHWYLIPFLPSLFILLAAAWPSASHRQNKRSRLIQAAILLAVLGIHGISFENNRALANHPIEPCRESVALTRQTINPYHPAFGKDTITASPGMSTEAYDPAVIDFDTPAELHQLIQQARSENRPLFLNFGFRKLLQPAHPEIFAMIDDPTLFEPLALLHGQFFASTREVHRLRPLSPSAPLSPQ